MKKYIRPRNRFFKIVIGSVLDIIHKNHNIHIKKDRSVKGPCLVLCNHQTSNDQFFVDRIFKHTVKFVATEDIFSLGIASKGIKWIYGPIMKMKSVADITTIRNCANTLKENGIVAIFPEGNRTYSSKLCNIDKSIAKMVKKFDVDVYFVNIVGGYAYQPRWADNNRKARVDVGIRSKLSKEEIVNMDIDSLYTHIINELDPSDKEKHLICCDETNRALYMERLFYVCPKCGAISSLHSSNNSIYCDKCDFNAYYNADLTFTSNLDWLDKNTIDKWYYNQEKWIKDKKLSYFNDYIFKDNEIIMKQTIPGKYKLLLGNGNIKMNNEQFISEIETKVFNIKLDEIIAITILGKHKMNIYLPNNIIYQFIGNKTFNPMKYMHLFYHYKYIKGGNKNDEFLGI